MKVVGFPAELMLRGERKHVDCLTFATEGCVMPPTSGIASKGALCCRPRQRATKLPSRCQRPPWCPGLDGTPPAPGCRIPWTGRRTMMHSCGRPGGERGALSCLATGWLPQEPCDCCHAHQSQRPGGGLCTPCCACVCLTPLHSLLCLLNSLGIACCASSRGL